MSDQAMMSLEIIEKEDGFYLVLPGKDPIGPFEDSETAISEAEDILEKAVTRLVESQLKL